MTLVGPRRVAPLAGFVMWTRGGKLVTTEMSTPAEVTDVPAASVATALSVKAPSVALLQVRQKNSLEYPRKAGLFVTRPRLFVPAKNCTWTTVSVKYRAWAQIWIFAPTRKIAPSCGETSPTVGTALLGGWEKVSGNCA